MSQNVAALIFDTPPSCAGHLGNMNELMLVSALAGAEMAMRDAGLPITPGSGVGKAIEYWHQTSKVLPTRESLLS
jgi:alanine-glyoxylate transaminase/serine-glyoxylate transaminase/serine-pyruvate transaminase